MLESTKQTEVQHRLRC